MIEIKNTISFAYPNGSAKPTMGELATFVKTLDSNPRDMDTMYRIAEEKAVFIKYKSEASMCYALTHNPEQLTFRYANGKAVEVRMSAAGGNVQYVRVFDLPPEVEDSDLSCVLGKYGKIKRVIREKFPVELGLDIYTGVRGVYMDVEKEIPSSLNFLNRKGNIFYSGTGNKHKCFICKAEGHRMNSCPKRKTRKDEGKKQPDEEQSGSGTYAGAVSAEGAMSAESAVSAGGASMDNNRGADEEVLVLDEEVAEMEVISPDLEKGSGEEPSVSQKQEPPVFKYKNDAYYYYKFGIVDYTEKERIKDAEEAKRLALWRENRIKEERELQARQRAEAKQRSPPRKTKKKT